MKLLQSISSLDRHDQALIFRAQELLQARFAPDRFFLSSVIRAEDGTLYDGFNFKTTLSKAAICAESVALAAAYRAGERVFDTIVTLTSYDPNSLEYLTIVSPCGMCRELLRDYAPTSSVIVPVNRESVAKVPLGELLPFPYTRDE